MWEEEEKKRIKYLLRVLRQYIKGGLVTIVTDRYFDELTELVLKQCEIA